MARSFLNYLSDKGLLIGVFLISAVYLSSMIAVFYFLFWFENPPATYGGLPFETDKSVYHIGDEVKVQADEVCRNTNGPFVRHVEFRRETEHFVEITPIDSIMRGGATKGCINNMIIPIGILPDNIPPGKGIVAYGKVVFDVPLGQRIAEWYTEPFEVIEK